MSFTATFGRPEVGILPLRHEGFDTQGWDLAMRASQHAVKVKGRLDSGEGIGEWEFDLDTAGDVTQWFCWPNAKGGRQIPGWAQVWPAIIQGGGGKGVPTPGGGGRNPVPTPGTGGSPPPVASTDPQYNQNESLGASGPLGQAGPAGGSSGVPAPNVGGSDPSGPPSVGVSSSSSNSTGGYNGRLVVGAGGSPATINGQSVFNSGFAGFTVGGSSSLSSLSGLQGVGTGSSFAKFTFGGSSSASSLSGIPGVGTGSQFAKFIQPADPYRPPPGYAVTNRNGSTPPANRGNGLNVHINPVDPNAPGGGAPGPGGDPGLPGDPGAPTKKACGVFSGSHEILPLIGEEMKPDSRFEALKPKMPEGDGFPKYAKGIHGLTVTSTNEEKQIEYFFPSWTGQLISVNQAGDPRMGTLVCDLTDDFAIDKDRTSPLQSMIRVVKKPLGAENALGWNIDKTGCKDTRGGFVGERPEGGGEDDYAYGLASYSDGGPLCVGSKTDKHRKGMDDDKHVINSLHIKTAAYFRLNDVEDGPLRFERPYKIGTEFDVPVAVHLAWTGEDWAWYTSGPMRYEPVPQPTLRPQIPTEPNPNPYPTYPKVNLTPVSPGNPSVPSTDPRLGPNAIPTIDGPGSIVGNTSVENVPMRLAASSMSLSSPGLVAQAQNYSPGQINTGMFLGNTENGMAKGANTNPVTGVMSAFGAQGGTPAGGGSSTPVRIGAQGDPWVYTNPPAGQAMSSNAPRNFRSGTSSGGWVIHPPETDLRDAASSGMVPPNRSLSTTYLITAPGAWFGAGTPELVNGSIRSGYSWGMDSATGDLLYRSHSFSETPVNAVRFTNTAQTIQWYATKSFYGELTHSNTGNRTYTFPDRTGPVGMMLTGTGSPAGSITAPESTMYWDTSGDDLYVNNDSSTGWTSIGGSGGGALELIENKEFGSAATTYTFSTLNGDTDYQYYIQYRIVKGAAGAMTITVRPNGLTTNQRSRWSYVGSAGTGTGTDTNGLAIAFNGSGSTGASEVDAGVAWIQAQTGANRSGEASVTEATGTEVFRIMVGWTWHTATSTNITSLDITSSLANGIGAGSFVRLYRVKKTA